MRGFVVVVVLAGCGGERQAELDAPVADAAEGPADGPAVDAALDAQVDARVVFGNHYIKASNPGSEDRFGGAIAISDDTNTLAIAAPEEASCATGIDGDQSLNNCAYSGAVYMFIRSGSTWVQQAYIKPANTDALDEFGLAVALSADGNVLVVGSLESSGATGIDGDQSDNTVPFSGAVYVFRRSGSVWSQATYIKPTDPQLYGDFGLTVDLSSDGATIAVGAQAQDNNFGAVYVFQFDGVNWAQQQRLVASNAQIGDYFGGSVALSGDGATLVVGAPTEDSAAVGVGGSQSDNSAEDSGAAYVFVRSGSVWSQQAYLKASNTETTDRFGAPVAISADGSTVVVGAIYEDSSAINIDGDQSNNGAMDSGAAYVFSRSGSSWTQAAYVKPSNTDPLDAFAWDLELSGDGSLLAIGAFEEDGTGTAYGGNPSANTKVGSGAVYLYRPSGASWAFDAYLKALTNNADDGFGEHLALPEHPTSIVVTATKEDGGSSGVDGDMTDNSTKHAGAAYIFE